MPLDCSEIHLLPGRLRIAIPGLYKNPVKALELERNFFSLTGVEKVQANIFTGKLLIRYNEQQVTLEQITASLEQLLGLAKDRQETAATLALLPSADSSLIPWYSMDSAESTYALGSHHLQGLTESEWLSRWQKYGSNILQEKKALTFWSLFWEQLSNFMTKLMLGASGVSFLLGEIMDGCTILTIVFLEIFIGIIQEYKAEKSLQALKDLTAPNACVCREGRETTIPASQLVPGDIIILETGDHVPADARLLESSNLEVVEGTLTGECLPVAKNAYYVGQGYLGIAQQKNMVFMGTNVTKGRAKGIVVATGMNTQMGKVAQMLNQIEKKPTPLQQGLDSLGKKLSLGCLGICGLIVLTGFARGRPLAEMFRMGVALAVGAMPEGLSAIVTLAMAFGVQRMVKRNAVVRKLPAVENIGYTSVICSDKTGTLTRNEMTVKEIYVSGYNWQVSGDGYHPQGIFCCQDRAVNPLEEEELRRALTIAALCNNSRLMPKEDQQWEIMGDPTEGALLVAAAKAGLAEETLNYTRLQEIPFDTNRRRMSVICVAKDQEYYLYSKGAPETILELCSSFIQDGKIKPLTAKEKKKILSANEKMSKKALRVLALAYKPLKQEERIENHAEQNLIFAGLMGMADPPRQEVKRALAKCRQAGIKVVMITGDQESTATAVAKELELLDDGLVLNGEQLAALSDQQLVELVDKLQVCTRTSPEQKLRIVRAFQQKKYIVAMTGDGVNDAPAIKESDIGIAMGKVGTDVTREASCIILTDDNFSTIVMAIEEGRNIGKNIGKAISYILAGNLGEVASIFLAALMGLPAPLTPCQILWVNLVTEGIMSFTLVTDPAEATVMSNPPGQPNGNILGRDLRKRIFTRGLTLGLMNFGVFLTSLYLTGGNLVKSRTIAFANLITSQLFYALDCRGQKGKMKSEIFQQNKHLLPSLLASSGLLLGIIYFPALQSAFQASPLTLVNWLLVLGGACLTSIFNKLGKRTAY